MSKFLWMLGGVCTAAVCFLVLNGRRAPRVEELAHRLEDAWADHHTVVS